MHPARDALAQTPPEGALTLQAAETRLREASRDLQRARRDVERAQAATGSAAARPNATLSIDTTDINPRRGIGAGPAWDKQVDTTVRLEQTFERGGKRELRMARADALLDAARALIRPTRCGSSCARCASPTSISSWPRTSWRCCSRPWACWTTRSPAPKCG
jgi:cobalt-zinc-cadmium efflux system outer membrane protein